MNHTKLENTKEMQSIEGNDHTKHASFNRTLTFVQHKRSSIINIQPQGYKDF